MTERQDAPARHLRTGRTFRSRHTGSNGTLASRARREKPDADRVMDFITKHPGSRSEEIAAELGADTASLRAVLHQLRDDGKISVQGKARATRYALA